MTTTAKELERLLLEASSQHPHLFQKRHFSTVSKVFSEKTMALIAEHLNNMVAKKHGI